MESVHGIPRVKSQAMPLNGAGEVMVGVGVVVQIRRGLLSSGWRQGTAITGCCLVNTPCVRSEIIFQSPSGLLFKIFLKVGAVARPEGLESWQIELIVTRAKNKSCGVCSTMFAPTQLRLSPLVSSPPRVRNVFLSFGIKEIINSQISPSRINL